MVCPPGCADASFSDPTPRPHTRHFDFDLLEQLEARRLNPDAAEFVPQAQRLSAQAAEFVPQERPRPAAEPPPAAPERGASADNGDMTQELFSVLATRRARLEASRACFESCPKESRADAKQELRVEEAPALGEWLQPGGPGDEVADLLAQYIKEDRGLLPAQAPRSVTEEELGQLKELSEQLAEVQKRLREDSASLEERRAEVEEQEARLREKQANMQREQEQRRKTYEEYPQPPWFDKPEGTINVGVVGNSGVGKSLLINRLRGVREGAEGWAKTGVTETTFAVSMYAFPSERRVRLWDFPGAGTERFPLENYIQRMGLRHLDSVIIVNASRFTQTEIKLMSDLESFGIPYFLVRTKVDLDVWNNEEDNHMDARATENEIREDLLNHCYHRDTCIFLVNLRNVKEYDFPALRNQVFPALAELEVGEDAWALPQVEEIRALEQQGPNLACLNGMASMIEGWWRDTHDNQFFVQRLDVHVTGANGKTALTQLSLAQNDNLIWYMAHWSIDKESVEKSRATNELRWKPRDLAKFLPSIWRRVD